MSITEYDEEACPACGAELKIKLYSLEMCCLRCGEVYHE
tara:strand:- start:2950 stop:3066 length:117 start_codon:yes stop_codon:yes gene_type:complete